MSNKNEKYEQIVGTDYKYGFHTDVENVYDTGKGISEEVVRKISAMKNELGSIKLTFFAACFQTLMAWVVAVFLNQILRVFIL